MGDLPNIPAKFCGFGCAALVLLSVIIFAVCMGSYVHLGPDDQVLLKRATGKYVKNGPWMGQLHPFHEKEWRKAELLDPLQYAVVQDILTSLKRTEEGPKLLFLGPYDELIERINKIVLQKHEFLRLTDRRTGEERVLHGPGTIVPRVTETHTGVQNAVFVNTGSAVVVRNKLTGSQELVTSCSLPSGVWYPAPLEEVIDVRGLIQVLPHEALVVRDVDGVTTVYSGREPAPSGNCGGGGDAGGVAFFLPPYSKILRMQWSWYSNPGQHQVQEQSADDARRLQEPPFADLVDGELPIGEEHGGAEEEQEFRPTVEHDGPEKHSTGLEARRLPKEDVYVFDEDTETRRLESIYADQVSSAVSSVQKRLVTAIDLRTQKSFYSFSVRTNDNVRLLLEGTIFWRVKDARNMLAMTSDPEGDVWSKCRSTLIAAISSVALDAFMVRFNDVVLEAFDASKGLPFWSDRGIEMISIELNNYKPLDKHTADTLQGIIRQTVMRINDLQKQRSMNDVLKEKLAADIILEANMTELYESQAKNSRIIAETAGAVDGGKTAASVGTFMNGVNVSLDNATERLQIYQQHLLLDSAQTDAKHLTEGSANLYMSPKEMELRLSMPSDTLATGA